MSTAPSEDSRETVIAVHGVGGPEPGQLLAEIAEGLKLRDDFTPQADTIAIGDDRYAKLTLDGHPTIARLFEVNWKDIREPATGLGSTIRFFIRLFLSLIQIGASGWRPAPPEVTPPSYAAQVFVFYVATFGLWIFGLPIIGLYMSVLEAPWAQGLAVGLLAFITFGAVYFSQQADRRCGIGFVWAVLYGALGAYLIVQPEAVPRYVQITTLIFEVHQIVGVVLILATGVELFLRMLIWSGLLARGDKLRTVLPYSVRLASLYLPWILMLALTFLVFLFHYLLFVHVLGLDSRFMEWVMVFQNPANHLPGYVDRMTLQVIGSVIAVVLLAWPLVPFFLSLRPYDDIEVYGDDEAPLREKLPRPSGTLFQDRIAFSLVLTPIVLLVISLIGLALLFDADRMTIWTGRQAYTGQERVNLWLFLYILGAVTLVLLLMGTLLQAVRYALRVTGDIVFYILPPDYPSSSARPIRERARKLIDYLIEQGCPASGLVGYSQGSVIAADMVRDDAAFTGRMVTLGSPIESLYGRFLKIPVPVAAAENGAWENLYRPTDFVAGPVPAAENTLVMGNPARHHMDYWTEPEIVNAIRGQDPSR